MAPSEQFSYGGQAVMEGVMMRGGHDWAVAVRAPSGEIITRRQPLSSIVYHSHILKWPFLRGLVMLWDSLGLGIRALMWSADVALSEEEEKVRFSGPLLWGTVAVSLALGVGLFVLLPMFLVSLLDQRIASDFWSNVAEGVLRLIIFLGYLVAIGFMPDIRRVFAYHGAEHKTINAYEAGAYHGAEHKTINAYEAGVPLEPEQVARFSRAHTRCGTGFLLIVVLLFVLIATLFGRPPLLSRLLLRLILIPIVSGMAYEFLKFTARYHDRSALVRALAAPGLALQKLTAREPDLDMLEVSITALKTVLASEGLIEPTDESQAISVSLRQTGKAVEPDAI